MYLSGLLIIFCSVSYGQNIYIGNASLDEKYYSILTNALQNINFIKEHLLSILKKYKTQDNNSFNDELDLLQTEYSNVVKTINDQLPYNLTMKININKRIDVQNVTTAFKDFKKNTNDSAENMLKKKIYEEFELSERSIQQILNEMEENLLKIEPIIDFAPSNSSEGDASLKGKFGIQIARENLYFLSIAIKIDSITTIKDDQEKIISMITEPAESGFSLQFKGNYTPVELGFINCGFSGQAGIVWTKWQSSHFQEAAEDLNSESSLTEYNGSIVFMDLCLLAITKAIPQEDNNYFQFGLEFGLQFRFLMGNLGSDEAANFRLHEDILGVEDTTFINSYFTFFARFNNIAPYLKVYITNPFKDSMDYEYGVNYRIPIDL